MEPENNILSIIRAYTESTINLKLLIVGLKNTNYYNDKLKHFEKNKNIQFIGGIYNKYHLDTIRLYSHAYIHGHSVGGTNPSLLESMGSSNLIIAHDNIFNRETLDNSAYFFKSVKELKLILSSKSLMFGDQARKLPKVALTIAKSKYNWNLIFKKYLKIIHEQN